MPNRKPVHERDVEVRLPNDDEVSVEIYSTDPLVCQLIDAYVAETDQGLDDVLYGPSETIAVPAPRLGLTTIEDIERTQAHLDRHILDR